jgi:imidazolonepropionase-like amidohydrolase
MRKILIFLLLTSASVADAQDAPRLLRAARMLDVRTGKILANPTILITGDRITAVNPQTPPANARVIDLGDVTILPGFIDAHTHLAGEIGPNMRLEPVTETEVDAAYKAVKHGRTTLLAGFTAVMSQLRWARQWSVATFWRRAWCRRATHSA